MNSIESKQVALVGFDAAERNRIAKIVKEAGGYFDKNIKTAKYFIKHPCILRTNNADEFSKNNNVQVIPLDKLYKYVGMEEQIPYVKSIYDKYDMHTNDDAVNYERYAKIVSDNVAATCGDSICFNDDIIDDYIGSFIDWDDVDNRFYEALEKTDVGLSKENVLRLKNAHNLFDISRILLDVFECISYYDLMAISIAIKHFVDPQYNASFKIYRDKWEYRGDYFGMVGSSRDIPPSLRWEINDRYPYGYLNVRRY